MRLVVAALALLLAIPAQAQLISIKTLPVAQSEQFDIYPSRNLAMGGVHIALSDPLLDPFVHPAKTSRVPGGRFYGSPLLYSVSNEAGAGRTLPVAVVGRRGQWFGTAAFALQQVDPSNQQVTPFFSPADIIGIVPEQQPGRAHGNSYAYAAFGRAFEASGLSLGGSIRWAGLNAIDGVDLLYAGSSSIDQHGFAGDVRLGLTKDWSTGAQAEVLVLYNRFRMQHDVQFLDAIWNPVTQTVSRRARTQQNFDYSDAWGVHLGFQRPVAGSEWRVGGILTANVMDHPKLPEYDVRSVGIVPIWRDPGTSYAFNMGFGASKTNASSTFAIDVVYEPIWTYTWGDATAPMATADGGVVPVGGKTIENWFAFNNVQFRMGVDQKVFPSKDIASLQLGIALHGIQYHMDQHDNVQAFWRSQNESWIEWAPTWGLTLRFPDLEISYRAHILNGNGRPGVRDLSVNRGFDLATADAGGSNILVAPNGPLTLTPVSVANHQISISVPIR